MRSLRACTPRDRRHPRSGIAPWLRHPRADPPATPAAFREGSDHREAELEPLRGERFRSVAHFFGELGQERIDPAPSLDRDQRLPRRREEHRGVDRVGTRVSRERQRCGQATLRLFRGETVGLRLHADVEDQAGVRSFVFRRIPDSASSSCATARMDPGVERLRGQLSSRRCSCSLRQQDARGPRARTVPSRRPHPDREQDGGRSDRRHHRPTARHTSSRRRRGLPRLRVGASCMCVTAVRRRSSDSCGRGELLLDDPIARLSAPGSSARHRRRARAAREERRQSSNGCESSSARRRWDSASVSIPLRP